MKDGLDPPFALDGSVALVWAFEDESDPYADDVLGAMADHRAIVPPLWIWEIANVLAIQARRGRIADSSVREFVEQLDEFDIEVALSRSIEEIEAIYDLARAHRLTAYDAEYLYLAIENGVPIATNDRELLAAMARAGIARFVP